MKKRMLVLVLSVLAFSAVLRAQQATYPVISELRFYETSGVNEEFVELYNPTLAAIDVSGWKIQYASAAGLTWSDKQVFPAGTVIPSHKFLLYGGTQVVPMPDFAAASVGLGNTGGHVRLVDAALNVIDKVGWLTAASPEGSAITPAHPRGASYERKANVASTQASMAPGGPDNLLGNGWDSNNNLNDFVIHPTAAAGGPQNSASPPEPVAGNVGPVIGAVVYTPNPITPAAAVTFDAVITDSDGSVALAVIHYGTSPGVLPNTEVLFPIGGNHFANGTPITAPGACQSLYYKIEATDDLGATTLSSEYNAPVQCLLTIAQIQGGVSSSPYAGMSVTTEGQVTYVQTASSMFMQDADGPWNGIQVFGPHTGVQEGDYIRVTGNVLEFEGFTELTNPLTIQVLASPGPLTISPVTVDIATANQEAYESVLVHVDNALCVDALNFIVFDLSDQIKIYFPAFTPLEDECYNITGVRYSFHTVKEILPRVIDEIQTCPVVEANDPALTFALAQAWPNPFNPTATISFSLDRTAPARLSVFNIIGQEVAVLAEGVLEAGRHQVTFDAAGLPSGLYLYNLQSEGRQLSGRMLLVR